MLASQMAISGGGDGGREEEAEENLVLRIGIV